jgi:hypothetical protein
MPEKNWWRVLFLMLPAILLGWLLFPMVMVTYTDWIVVSMLVFIWTDIMDIRDRLEK